MSVDVLDRRAEKKLASAVAEVHHLVEGGSTPDDALHKVASRLGLPPGHVTLCGHAYNNGATLDAVQNGSGLAEKAAEFPLCDPGAVLERLYPSREKLAAAAKYRPDAVSTDYAMPPSAVKAAAALAVKAAEARKAASEFRAAWREKYGSEEEAPAEKAATLADAYRTRNQLIKAAEDKQAAARSARDEAEAALNKVAAYFRTGQGVSFATVRENWTLVKGAADALFDEVLRRHPGVRYQKPDNSPATWGEGPYGLVESAIDKSAAFIEAKQAAAAEVAGLPGKFGELFQGYLTRRPDSLAGSDPGDREKAAFLGSAGAFMFGTGTEIGKSVAKPTPTSDLVAGVASRIGDPQHEEELSAIRTRSMLDQLMLTDDVIKGYEPKQVVDAYSQLSSVSPRAVRNPVYARTMLRKYLEQGGVVDPFEINQLLDAENKLVTRESKIPGQA